MAPTSESDESNDQFRRVAESRVEQTSDSIARASGELFSCTDDLSGNRNNCQRRHEKQHRR
jgi:hypothetical protein